MKELMTSSRCFKLSVLALIAVFLLSALAVPGAAVEVTDEQVPEEGEVGAPDFNATFTIGNLYQNPSFNAWNLTGETELENVTWTVAFRNAAGRTVAQRSYNGQEFRTVQISTDTDIDDDGETEAITELIVTVRGEVPEIDEHTWPEQENFTVARLVQSRGENGSTNLIGSWSAHHYTTPTEDEEYGSADAREALANASQAIENAKADDINVSDAEETLDRAISAYESGNFENAVSLARDAREQAQEARSAKEQSERTSQLLLWGGGAIVVLLVIGGGVYYWRAQADDYDKLG